MSSDSTTSAKNVRANPVGGMNVTGLGLDNNTGATNQSAGNARFGFSESKNDLDAMLLRDSARTKPDDSEYGTGSPEYHEGRDGGFAVKSPTSRNGLSKVFTSLGLDGDNVSESINAASTIVVQRNDVLPDELAKKYTKRILHDFPGDRNKQVAFVVLLKHLAMNSSSARAPETRVYELKGQVLDISEVHAILGDDLRRYARAHADAICAIIRNDRAFARELSRRYGVAVSDAVYAFDVAEYATSLTLANRQRIAQIKVNVLNNTTYDSRHLSAIVPQNSGGSDNGIDV